MQLNVRGECEKKAHPLVLVHRLPHSAAEASNDALESQNARLPSDHLQHAPDAEICSNGHSLRWQPSLMPCMI